MNLCAIDCHVHLLDVAFGGGSNGLHAALKYAPRFGPDILSYFERFKYNYFIRKNNPLIYAVEKLIMLSVAGRTKSTSPARLADSMLAAGIKYSIIHPVYPYVTTDEVYKLCDFKAFFPFTSPPVDNGGCLGQAESDLNRGCLGIKIHPLVQGLDLDSIIYKELAALAASQSVPLLTHFGGSPAMFGLRNGLGHLDARKIRTLALHAPNALIIVGHIGLWQNEEVLSEIKGLDNVYADTSFQPAGFIKKAAAAMGSKRLLLGSDFPIGNQKLCRDNILRAGLSDSETEDILYKNALRILNFNKSKNNFYAHLANNLR